MDTPGEKDQRGRRARRDVPPDIELMPDGALLTRRQIVAYTGFTEAAFKKWAREGRGPALTYLEGRPRTTVRDFRAWIAGTPQAAAPERRE